MSLLWRSWFAFVGIMATALTVLAFLSILQHDAVLSRLVQQRLAVIAQTTASSFRSVVDLGLPLSMMRNADKVLKRAKDIDPTVTAVRVFNPSGIIVNSSDVGTVGTVSKKVLQTFALSKTNLWRVESPSSLHSGFTIKDSGGKAIGAVVVVYPKQDFIAKTDAMAVRISIASVLLLAVCSMLALLVLRVRMAGAIRGVSKLDRLYEHFQEPDSSDQPNPKEPTDTLEKGFLASEIQQLEKELKKADQQYNAASGKLAAFGNVSTKIDNDAAPGDQSGATVIAGQADSPLARSLARHLIPWATLLILGSALLLGYFVYTSVERSFQPELSARSKLIGTVANNSIQRAVSSGVPLEKLVGAEQYFGDLLKNFPEISYFGVATGRIILESGTRQKSIFAPERSRKDVPTFPITTKGKQIGYIIVDANPEYFALQFRDVLLDFGVVVLVVILLAFQIMLVTISRSLTAPFVRLQHLAGFQAAGDFSKLTGGTGSSAVDRLCQLLSDRSASLHRTFTTLSSKLTARKQINALNRIQKRFKIQRWWPDKLQFSYLNDVRLPLFLFAAADELPLSFFPLYARAADNPLTWLDQGMVISLPLAGYLLAIVLISPLARPLAERFGHRNLLLMAIVPTVVAHIGLYLSSNVIEIIAFRTITGFGYAIATLACQDYVLDVVPREQRNRALGHFTAALFSGIFAGTAIGGILADRLGQDVVFAISAGLVLVSGFLTMRFIAGRPPEKHELSHKIRNYVPPIWQPLRSLRFTTLLFGIAIPANVLLQAFISFLVALQMEAIGASAADTGRILMVYFLVIALLSPVFGRFFENRIDPSHVAISGAVISGLCLCVPVFWPSQWSMFVAVGGAGIGHGMIRDTQVAIAMEIAERDLARIGANAVLGSLRTLERGGSIAGLICIALISSFSGLITAIGAVAVWVMAGAAVFAFGMALRRRTTRLREQ
jgi:predicted MFS family arabinose efflux permease